LVSVWWWTLAGALAVTLVEAMLLAGEWSAVTRDALRFSAWSLTLCPAIAVLGMKRPQHIGWNFVVLSLWGVLLLPVAECVWLRPGQPLDLGSLRPWFLVAMLFVGPITSFAGRWQGTAVLLAVGQGAVLLPQLPLLWSWSWSQPAFAESRVIAGILCFAGAAVVAEWQYLRPHDKEISPFDRLWLDCRDSFGLFWSLRFAERVNAAAGDHHWPIRLEWNGFVSADDRPLAAALAATPQAELRGVLRGMWRRFVDEEWLQARGWDETREASQR
jgi:hypothetical protein